MFNMSHQIGGVVRRSIYMLFPFPDRSKQALAEARELLDYISCAVGAAAGPSVVARESAAADAPVGSEMR